MTEQLYAKVSAIVGSVSGYTGTYLVNQVTALRSGQIDAETFADNMRTADVKLAEACEQLRAIRFFSGKQRSTHGKLLAALTEYRTAMQYVNVDDKLMEAHLDRALALGDAYFSAVFKDRMRRRKRE